MAIRSVKKIYLYLCFFALLVIGLHFSGALAPLERALQSLFSPSLSSLHGFNVNIGDRYRFFQNKEDFFAAYAECSIGALNHAKQSAELAELRGENAELKKQLGYVEKTKQKTILAEVIGKETSNTEQTFILNRGEDQGVKANQPVIVGEGILVGKITKVDKNTSVVRLINDSQSKIAATILNHDKSLGVLEGGYGISLRLNLIPRDEVIKVGDQVITSGLELTMPGGLLVGSVAVVENEPYKPFQQAVLTSSANLSKLHYVTIIQLE